jgi:hypothetical protein
MASRQDNASSRNQQNNTGSIDTTLNTAGDLLIKNRFNTTTGLSIGQEDYQLTVSNGQATWQPSTGQAFEVGYWSYPSSTAWNATWGENGVPFNQTNLGKYNHAKKFYAEFLTLNSSGEIVTASTSTQGGYTTSNVTLYKANCQELWTTVSSANNVHQSLLTNNLGTTGAQAITDIVTFVTDNDLAGVDINFEDFGSWSAGFVTNFNTWLGSLKTALNAVNASLNFDFPYIGNATIQSAYNFNYADFIDNLDTATLMLYDIFFDWGYGMGHSPKEALVGGSFSDTGHCDDAADQQGTTTFYEGGTLGKFISDNNGNNLDKLVIGLPNIGFAHANSAGAYSVTGNLTKNKINLNSTYGTHVLNGGRDSSGELRWFGTSHTFTYCDGQSLRNKAEVCRQYLKKWELDNPTKTKPRYEIMIWHCGGGNDSFYD